MYARTISLVVTAAFGALAGCGSDDFEVATNQGFDRWCDAGPCGWDASGPVYQATTWHAKDYAVEFGFEGESAISQRQGRTPKPCLHFDVVAKVDPGVFLHLLLDFNDDGTPDWRQSISEANWKSVPFVIPTPIVYDNVRFILRKRGDGRAVLAQIVITDPERCPDDDPLLLLDGSRCALDAVCESGACVAERCVREIPTGSE